MLYRLKNRIRRFFSPTPKHLHFLVIGAQKSGTTALDRYLRKHPQIGLPPKKEVHFFDTPHYFDNPSPYEEYHQHFNFKAKKLIYGEITPSYIYCQETPRRIYEYNPRIKIIAILRNPIDRAYSQWNMNRKEGTESLSFEEAIRIEKERAFDTRPYQNLVYSYTDRGFYSEQIRRYQRYFKDHKMHIVLYDDLKNKPTETLQGICQFLGVRPLNKPIPTEHKLEYNEPLNPETRKHLQDYFRHDILEVERLLGVDCSHWLS